MQSDVERELDRALEERAQRQAREAEQHASILDALQHFLMEGERALRAATVAIERRAEALDLATPIEVKAEIQPGGGTARTATLSVSMTAAPTNRRQGMEPARYTWSVLAHASPDTRGEVRASFSISAFRGGWQDIWSENSGTMRTPECNPRGLSLESTGEEITARFMAWFTRYIAR